MPIKIAYILPVIYAILGSILWNSYGVSTTELLLWIGAQLLMLLTYIWLIRGGATGIMMKLHLVVTLVGMILLFFVLMPWRSDQSTDRIIWEFIIMGVGTFLCAFGIYTLIYMVIRKLVFHLRGGKVRIGETDADQQD